MANAAVFEVESSRRTDFVINVGSFQTATNTASARSLPSFRPVTQAYFWTPEWQQKERLADYDFLSGNVFEPADADDLINHLHEEAEAS